MIARLGLDGLDRRALFPLLVLVGLNAVDELDRSAFEVLSPEIRDHFGLSNTGIALVQVALVPVVLLLTLPIGYWADRRRRTPIATGGAAVWAVFSVATGLAPIVLVLVFARGLAGVGRAVNDPVHQSLIADYYPPENRAGAYSLWTMANPIGRFLGPLVAGGLAVAVGWRAPFVVLAVPTIVFVVLSMRLPEPVRGRFERLARGADEDLADTEEEEPSWEESWRTLNGVRSLRTTWHALPFLMGGLLGIAVLLPLYYDEVFGIDELGRGVLAASAEPFTVAGLLVGIPISTRLVRTRPAAVLRLFAGAGVAISALFVLLAFAPNVWWAGVLVAVMSFVGAVLQPGIATLASIISPPRARSFSFSVIDLWVLPGLVFVVLAAAIGDAHGLRVGMLSMVPVFLVGTLLVGRAGAFVARDIEAVQQSSLAHAEHQRARAAGHEKLLVARGVEVHYGQVQVLFGVDFEVDDGEIVALLGTNGAGKSTLLKAIVGLVDPSGGAVVFDGHDLTFATPQGALRKGVVYMPGGHAVFPTLTVAQNLTTAGWRLRAEPDRLATAVEDVYVRFPRLRERADQPAGNLSGGEQQMLGLGMALIARPRLLLIDELSLGLAPAIVADLLDTVRALNREGTTVVLVEQSVNVALSVAERAVFLEKGEVRFEGLTSDLLARDDIVRSVFLAGATDSLADAEHHLAGPARDAQPALAATGLTRRYGGIVAVDGVDLAVARGEIVGIIGPNGAGKTTLFDLLSGFQAPDAGTVALAGTDVTGWSPAARARAGLGRSFQDARLFPSMTVREAIATAYDRHLRFVDPLSVVALLPDQIIEERLVQQRVDELIEALGLGAYADKFVSELSTGTRRIVDLAGALAHKPRVLLLDEPSSGIAQREAEALGPLLGQVRTWLDTSLVVIEHDIPLITAMSDRMVALDLGHVAATGTPAEVVAHPAVVASYLGDDDGVAVARSGSGSKGARS